jgi:hypothetical protein
MYPDPFARLPPGRLNLEALECPVRTNNHTLGMWIRGLLEVSGHQCRPATTLPWHTIQPGFGNLTDGSVPLRRSNLAARGAHGR